jgi:hypothetical protein
VGVVEGVATWVEVVAILEVVVTLVAAEAISAAAVSTLAGVEVISAVAVRILAAVRNSVAAASAEVRISAVAATSVFAGSRHRTGVTSALIISPAGHISPADRVLGTLALAVISIAITSGTEGFAISTADGGMRTHGGLEVTEGMPTGPMCAHRVGGIARTGTIAAWLTTASIEATWPGKGAFVPPGLEDVAPLENAA